MSQGNPTSLSDSLLNVADRLDAIYAQLDQYERKRGKISPEFDAALDAIYAEADSIGGDTLALLPGPFTVTLIDKPER